MGLFNRNRTSKEVRKKEHVFSKMLDDLTTLEINTIIKDGMTASVPPENIERTLKDLLERYKDRIGLIVYNNSHVFDTGVDFDTDFSRHKSFKGLYEHLIKCKERIDAMGREGLRIDDTDYSRINRMLSFCRFIQERSESTQHGIRLREPYENETLYEIDLTKEPRMIIDTRDMVRINRFYDLGVERIVMQTRFGIDGDVVTRIEEDFSNKPKQLVTNIHEAHTNMSVNYWKSLIDIVKGIVFHA